MIENLMSCRLQEMLRKLASWTSCSRPSVEAEDGLSAHREIAPSRILPTGANCRLSVVVDFRGTASAGLIGPPHALNRSALTAEGEGDTI